MENIPAQKEKNRVGSPASSRWFSLPKELIRRIVEYSFYQGITLGCLSRVCKNWNEAVQGVRNAYIAELQPWLRLEEQLREQHPDLATPDSKELFVLTLARSLGASRLDCPRVWGEMPPYPLNQRRNFVCWLEVNDHVCIIVNALLSIRDSEQLLSLSNAPKYPDIVGLALEILQIRANESCNINFNRLLLLLQKMRPYPYYFTVLREVSRICTASMGGALVPRITQELASNNLAYASQLLQLVSRDTEEVDSICKRVDQQLELRIDQSLAADRLEEALQLVLLLRSYGNRQDALQKLIERLAWQQPKRAMELVSQLSEMRRRDCYATINASLIKRGELEGAEQLALRHPVHLLPLVRAHIALGNLDKAEALIPAFNGSLVGQFARGLIAAANASLNRF